MDYFEQNLYVTKDWGALTSEEKNEFNSIFLRGNTLSKSRISLIKSQVTVATEIQNDAGNT